MKKINYKRLAITAAAFFILYFALVFFIYKAEAGEPGANINALEDALWFSIVTLTTVGYGDLYPITSEGRFVGYIFLLFSLIFYAILIGQIANLMRTINENKRLGMHGTKFKNHVVVIGWTDFGKAVTDQLIAAGREVAIITKDKDSVDLIHELYTTNKSFVLFSDYNNFEMLQKVNIRDSTIVFINLKDDTEKLVYVLNLKKHYENLKFIVTLDNANLKSTFQTAGVTYAVSQHEIASKLLASYIFEPDVAAYSEEIISYPRTEEHYDIKQYRVLENNPYAGQFYEKAFFELKKDYNVVLIGIVKNNNGAPKLMKNPAESMVIDVNDYLVMIMNKNGMKKMSRYFKIEEGING